MKLLIIIVLLISANVALAQLTTTTDNTSYNIAQMIANKATEKKLGNIHAESSVMRPTAGKGGYFLRYEKGWVYYNPTLNKAFAIWGENMKKYQDANFEVGWLGFPTTDLKNTPNRTGTYQHFDNGSIYYSATTGYHFVGGAFKEYWKNLGWENSPQLGFPKTDEKEIFKDGYTRYQQFEKGTLFFGAGKDVLYSSNANDSVPPQNTSKVYTLQFEPVSYTGYGDGASTGARMTDLIDLYGWMDVRVYKGNNKEIVDESSKSFSLFNIPEKNKMDNLTNDVFKFEFTNSNFLRTYAITQDDINANAYIRITYWLNDHDDASSNDYLKLLSFNGSWKYNNGNHVYREIKLKDIDKKFGDLQTVDLLVSGNEKVNITYNWKLVKK